MPAAHNDPSNFDQVYSRRQIWDQCLCIDSTDDSDRLYYLIFKTVIIYKNYRINPLFLNCGKSERIHLTYKK